MKKTFTILATIIIMAITLCGCGAPKEVISHPERTETSKTDATTYTTISVEESENTVEAKVTEDSSDETIELRVTEDSSEEVKDNSPIWPTTGWLADLIPHTDYITEVEVLVDKPSDFQANVTNLSKTDFDDYKYQLTVCGWSTVLTSTDDMFIANHDDGIHRIAVQPNSLDMDITYIRVWEVLW